MLGLRFPYPTHILTLWSWWKRFWADDGATSDKLCLRWVCCSFVLWTNYGRRLCKTLGVCLFIHLKDRVCSVVASLPFDPGLPDSLLWHIPSASPGGIAFKPRYSLALFKQVSWHFTLNSVAAPLTVSLPGGPTSTDHCTTQLIPTSFACWSSTSVWPRSLTQNRYDFKDHSLTCAPAAKSQIGACTRTEHVYNRCLLDYSYIQN